jgi:DNA-binding NtrC family response regulator
LAVCGDEAARRDDYLGGGYRVNESIFYFDDDVACLNLFQEMFGGEYDVRTASTLAEALRMLAERPANIIISDQVMPEIDGKEFLRKVASTYPTSYRVMLTGSITVGGSIAEIGVGLIHIFVSKPWSKEGMQKVLERASIHPISQRIEGGGASHDRHARG